MGDQGKIIVAKGFEKLSKKSPNLDTLLLRDENISMVGDDYFIYIIHLNCSNIAVNFGTLFDGEITSYFHPPVKRFCTSKVCSKFSVFIRYCRCFRLNFFGKLAKCFCLFSFFSQDKCSTNLAISVDSALGTRTRGGRMVGTVESTELWQHPFSFIGCLQSKNKLEPTQAFYLHFATRMKLFTFTHLTDFKMHHNCVY